MIAILLLIPREAKTKEVEGEGRIYLEARAPLPVGSYATLGVKTASRGIREPQNTNAMVQEIIRRESGGNPKAKNPNSTAYGICQFLSGTWSYVQEKWDMKLEREDPDDQLYACTRLYREEGLRHWITSFPEYAK